MPKYPSVNKAPHLVGNFFVRDGNTKVGVGTGLLQPLLDEYLYHTFVFDMTSAVVMEKYASAEAAIAGHDKWVKFMDIKNPIKGW